MRHECIGHLKNSFFLSLSHCLQRPYHVLVTGMGAGNNTPKDINPVFKTLTGPGGGQAGTHSRHSLWKSHVNLENTGLELCRGADFKVAGSRFFSSLFSLYIEWIPEDKQTNEQKSTFLKGRCSILRQREKLSFCLCLPRSYFNEELGDASPGWRAPATCLWTENACRRLLRTARGWWFLMAAGRDARPSSRGGFNQCEVVVPALCLLSSRITYTVLIAWGTESLKPGSEVWKCPQFCFLTSLSFSFSSSEVRIRASNSEDDCVAETR